jgi:colanic acid biosynthesis glycosyl transferase WcaI
MRIVVHDYAGHPGQIYMSRELARQGNEVLHLYAGSLETPRGDLAPKADDPPGFTPEGVFLSKPFQKYTYVRRQLQEIEYGKIASARIAKFKPDVVLSGNTPLFPQARMIRDCRRAGVAFVFWVMDVYGLAVYSALRKKIPVLGSAVGRYYMHLEKQLLRASDKIILISEGFAPAVESWGVPMDRVEVVPLWPPLEELPVLPKDNEWSRSQGLDKTTNLIYSGTLGTKHNPETLVVLAQRLKERPDARVIVISQGVGSRYLEKRIGETGLTNLQLLPYQPYEQLPHVLASADVLLALLEPSAGEFSVPGKVLSHLCSARPQVAAVPMVNRAAKVIQESGGGFAIPVGDDAAFVDAVLKLVDDRDLNRTMGEAARRYAETEFDIRRIAARMQGIMQAACDTRKTR